MMDLDHRIELERRNVLVVARRSAQADRESPEAMARALDAVQRAFRAYDLLRDSKRNAPGEKQTLRRFA